MESYFFNGRLRVIYFRYIHCHFYLNKLALCLLFLVFQVSIVSAEQLAAFGIQDNVCMMKDSRSDRMNVESDGLGNLPDHLIHKILSSFSIKHVVQLSILSSRWRFIWISMPYLNFLTEDFSSMNKFMQAITYVLSRRDDQIELTSLKLGLHQSVSRAFAKRILSYAFSHNVQHMTITCLVEKKIEFPLSIFRSRSLKHLTLVGFVIDHSTSTWKLPALTTLHLRHVTLYDDDEDDYDDEDIFSDCANLKSLILDGCKIKRLGGFGICHDQLTDLTLQNGYWGWGCVYVVVPKLKNLTVVNCDWFNLSAPCLTSIKYAANYSLGLYPGDLPRLEALDLCIRKPRMTDAHDIVRLLQQCYNVKLLIINLEIIEVLSSSEELISSEPFSFANLRSLRIYPVSLQLEGQTKRNATMSNEVRSYLLANSPSFSMVTPEEIRARNVTLAQHLMGELRVMLEQEKAIMNWDRMGRSVLEEDDVGWEEELAVQRKYVTTKICIVSKLLQIEGIMKKLPTSERAKMQSCFSFLHSEAKFVTREIDGMKHKDTV